MSKFSEAQAAILARDPRAWARVADRVRQRGGSHRDVFKMIRWVHEDTGRKPPSFREFEAIMLEAERW